jgi:2-amino-4-hydroxy-6-hydroxymethyldihydropteridine diphosphokinase
MTEDEVFLGLGANLGNRRRNIAAGLSALERGGVRIRRRSSLYETEPVGKGDQPWFLNAIVAAETDLAPRELLLLCKRIEKESGRRRTVRFGPRPLDIDILLYKGRVIREEDLEIPHPRMRERRFVLIPLVEIAEGIKDPRDGRRFSEILALLDEEKKVTRSRENGF